jgi:hypothetical protein
VSAPGEDAITKKMADRILKLRVDGYLKSDHGMWMLTPKGWAVLFAEAETPMYKPDKRSP